MQKRHTFGKLKAVVQPPDLIEIQTKSYRDFLQADIAPAKREDIGLQAVFKEIFPIESYDGRYTLDFVKYEFHEPKQTALECLAEGNGTYAAPLHATFRLKDGAEVREEDVYLGEIPLMTRDGAFVVNGAERVVVSQLHRSPGICSEKTVHPNGTNLFSMRIIPDHGSWIEIQFDTNDQLWVYMDRRRRRRKFRVTAFLRALGYSSDEDILSLFYTKKVLNISRSIPTGEAIENLVFQDDIADPETGVFHVRRYEKLSEPVLRQLKAAGIKSIQAIDSSWDEGILLETLRNDDTHNEEDALKDIYHKLRPGDPATASAAKQFITRLFKDEKHYDLGLVGRYKIAQKLHGGEMFKNQENTPLRVLDNRDVIEAIKHLIAIRLGTENVDDIDHLGSRRIRTVGELLENQCRVGLARTERVIRERMTLHASDAHTAVPVPGKKGDAKVSGKAASPAHLVNSKSLSSVVNDFFGRSQLSQFMDQTNPLSALAHKRRLSALGPGGLSRDRAGFEVRDVHTSHYGRICPIETPEGPNIGLISSLSIYAKTNDYGFIECPYRRVENCHVTDEVKYLSADDEEKYVIAQANAPLDENNNFRNPKVLARYGSEFLRVDREKVQFMDVSPKQMISIAAGLIPFLEHDDANRALMGANMMRQAVPLLRTERPYVATGLEGQAARDSRVVVMAEEDGVIARVDAREIIITADGTLPKNLSTKKNDKGFRRYELQKFRRTNASTCFNQKPIVRVGETVRKGDVIADGPATDQGELAIGKNLLVAFMPWCGYNFEDAILVSQRVVRDDIFTSVHITEYECIARETKLGSEEITRDIPNVSEDSLRNLGPDGVIRVGAEVRPGDILVGKVSPKGETELAPEEKLLHAIFGEKAADVRDSSLTVPTGSYGIVMDVKVSNEEETRRSRTASAAVQPAAKKEAKDVDVELAKKRAALIDQMADELAKVFQGEKTPVDIIQVNTQDILASAGKKLTKAAIQKIAENYDFLQMEDCEVKDRIDEITDKFGGLIEEEEAKAEDQRTMLESESADFDDEEAAPRGTVKKVRVYLAEKKTLSVGDKLSGRHGNKGVVARVLPDCDMPFLPNGQPVDIVLNPMGVPSRMNIGQVFETHLGAACRALGLYAGTPVFDGVTEKELWEKVEAASKVPDYEWMKNSEPDRTRDYDGKVRLRDGRTGEPFDQRVVVGVIYMLKLHHLVTDKIHARSVGPYSLVTQQPLGGKAQAGGQRMGEMEVWALEAYGVAYALQELLTVKSDDVAGRTRIYDSIVKGQNILQAGMPESFSVLMNELRGLCLDMQLKSKKKLPEVEETLEETPVVGA